MNRIGICPRDHGHSKRHDAISRSVELLAVEASSWHTELSFRTASLELAAGAGLGQTLFAVGFHVAYTGRVLRRSQPALGAKAVLLCFSTNRLTTQTLHDEQEQKPGRNRTSCEGNGLLEDVAQLSLEGLGGILFLLELQFLVILAHGQQSVHRDVVNGGFAQSKLL